MTVVVVKIAAPTALALVSGSPSPSASASGLTSTAPSPSPSASPAPGILPTTPAAAPGFDKTRYSLDDPTSLWVVVNKQRAIAGAADFVPPNLEAIPAEMKNPFGQSLRTDTVDALAAMFAADKTEAGTTLIAQSGYRSYSTQVSSYQYYVNQDGVAGADQTSARPGFSEHQTGLAIDILDTTSGCTTDYPCFGKSTSGQWLAANAYRFGFILRYPADKTAVTGYEYEPWHFRYVGTALATEMHAKGVETLEEFFGLPAAPGYAG
ncbi:D-alanyl-D-alanine carboxypeptidase family protein [Subtercola vilae]|uniref:D-alanyl-D-alanine carboxypeptidase family protein n=1 Tax=Subtercola vilae TaxID=2056433 RepID=A0A4T2BND4_9MICO|nr:D-alanyl-D-alanine carboxypeptidase family protein [Subtercola vilae]